MVNLLFNIFVNMTLSIFILKFGKIRIQEDIKLRFNMSIEEMSASPEGFVVLNVIFTAINLVIVSHLVYWQKFLENSWCDLNFFSREKIDTGRYKFS